MEDFQFPLPEELIAQVPAGERERARLLVLDRGQGTRSHTTVSALPELLEGGDVLVLNDTRVIAARLFARSAGGAAVELLFVRMTANGTALCLGKPAKRLRQGAILQLDGGARAVVAAELGDGRYGVAFEGIDDLGAYLEENGEIPLPPYIRRPDGPLRIDASRYQTVFAATPGAVAAPTAGLHLSETMLAALSERGIEIARLTLHVGPGTFLPVRCSDFRRHVMEPEWYEIPERTAVKVRRAKADGRRVVAVGTTTTRALESAAQMGPLSSGSGWAGLFITPGHRFRVVDALFTNFHLPGSTLLLLVSAFAGREPILAAYAEAIADRYRFYSYGDAMLIQ